jgi:RimJ/RimL family protein N-acetyltransferase
VLTIRQALLADSDDLLAWRNDTDTIAMSLSACAVSPDEHTKWFQTTLSNSGCVHVIGERQDASGEATKIGVCRFDFISNSVWEVSVNLSPAERSKGYAAELLHESIVFFGNVRGHDSCTLRAVIRSTNAKSVRIFEHNKFRLSYEDSGVLVMLRELFN